MRKWISGENSSLSCRISETGRTRVLNKWNLWDEFKGLFQAEALITVVVNRLIIRGSIIFNRNFNNILTYGGGKFVLLL